MNYIHIQFISHQGFQVLLCVLGGIGTPPFFCHFPKRGGGGGGGGGWMKKHLYHFLCFAAFLDEKAFQNGV